MKPISERLWARVDKRGPGECWEWQGWRHPAGHGQIGRGRRADGLAYTHVVAWELTNGPVPDGSYVCHHCDNPPCCNPDHLFLGSPAANTHDMIAKLRHSYGEAHATKLCDHDVQEVRRLLASGRTQQSLADEFGVSRSMIGHIGQFKRWSLTGQDVATVDTLQNRPAPGESPTCSKGHVYADVGFYKNGSGRLCKACHRERTQRYLDSGGREKKRAQARKAAV